MDLAVRGLKLSYENCKVEILQVHKSRGTETRITLWGTRSFEEGENDYNKLVLARGVMDWCFRISATKINCIGKWPQTENVGKAFLSLISDLPKHLAPNYLHPNVDLAP